MVGGSLTSSASAGANAMSEMPANATGAKFDQPTVHVSSQIVSLDETFFDWDDVIAALRWQRPARFTSAIMPVATGGQIVAHQKYERESLGFDDRDDLSFSDHVVEFDQNCLDFPGNCRSYRDFHLHRFDERNLVAVTDAARRLLTGSAHTRPATSVTILISGMPPSGTV